MLKNILNVTCEAQIAASDGRVIVVSPRQSKDYLRSQIDKAYERGLTVLAVALYNCHNGQLYDWRDTLENRHWLGRPLAMVRYPGEYQNTQHAIIRPAQERVYTVDEFQRAFCQPVARLVTPIVRELE